MSSGLVLFPVINRCNFRDGHFLPTDRLVFDYDLELFYQVRKIVKIRPSMGCLMFDPNSDLLLKVEKIIETQNLASIVVDIYDETGRQCNVDDKRGDSLNYVRVAELREIRLSGKKSAHNNAILAYVQALPANTPIILCWIK